MLQAKIEKIGGRDHLIVAIPMQEPELSNSGKTLVVGKTFAPVKTNVEVNGKVVTYTASAWIKKD